jgi:hypothetical protein
MKPLYTVASQMGHLLKRERLAKGSSSGGGGLGVAGAAVAHASITRESMQRCCRRQEFETGV